MLPQPAMPTPRRGIGRGSFTTDAVAGQVDATHGPSNAKRTARERRDGVRFERPHPPPTRALVRTDQLALQLYTVRESLETDLPATLGRVADSGVEAVELAGLPPIEPEALRDALATAGLRPMASHESLERIQSNPDAVIARLHTLGIRRAVIPWLRPELRS